MIAVLPGSRATKVGVPGTVKVTPPPEESVSLLPPPPHPDTTPMLTSATRERSGDERLNDSIRVPKKMALVVLITGQT